MLISLFILLIVLVAAVGAPWRAPIRHARWTLPTGSRHLRRDTGSAPTSLGAPILTEAALSFLGAGVPPTSPTWGNMIATAQEYMQNADWLILAPGLCIVLTVLALQAVGDGLRDALDPRLRRLT